MKMHKGNFHIWLYIRRNITLTFVDVLINSIGYLVQIRETTKIQTKNANEGLYYHMIIYNHKWLNHDTLNCFK